MKKTLLLAAALLSTSYLATAGEHTLYDDPIYFGAYVTDPRAAIRQGVAKYNWAVREELPGKSTVYLRHRARELALVIAYDDTKIWFQESSAAASGCKQVRSSRKQRRARDDEPAAVCKVSNRKVLRWRINLRRGISQAIGALAMADAAAKYGALSNARPQPEPRAKRARRDREPVQPAPPPTEQAEKKEVTPKDSSGDFIG